MKKTNRKTPQSVKTQLKIDAAVDAALKQQSQVYIHVKQQDAADIERLKETVSKLQKSQVLPVLDVSNVQKKSLLPVRDPKNGLLIPNANQGWKLFSNIAFASILASQAFFANLDPEVIAALPDNIQYYVTGFQALIGIAARLINQTKRKGVADVRNFKA